MTSILEKGGAGFEGVELLLCENPLPPLDVAIAAAQAEVPRSDYYTEAHSAPLQDWLAGRLGVPLASARRRRSQRHRFSLEIRARHCARPIP
jgi:hypothetical protein